MADRQYTDEQAQEILRIASQTSMGSGRITSQQLVETAAELGIRPEEVLQAEQAFLEREELAKDRVSFMQYKRKELIQEVSRWVSLSILLYGIAFLTNGFQWRGLVDEWPKWPVGIMGILLIKSAIEVVVDLTVNREANFAKWRQKQLKKRIAAADEQKNAKSWVEQVVTDSTKEDEFKSGDPNQVRS